MNLDQATLASLTYKRNYGLLVRIAARIVQNIHIAVEVVDRSIYDILNSQDSLFPDQSESEGLRFLILAVRREALNCRRDIIHRAELQNGARELIKYHDHNARQIEVQIAVHKALNLLTDRDKQIAWRVLALGEKQKEVAKSMDVNRHTIANRLNYIIPILRRELREYENV